MTFFNANQGPAPGYETFWVWNNIFQSLLTLTPPPDLKIVPELATSWEVLDAGKTYVFHLVQGAKFHDGTDFNAEAAKWNFDRILDPETKSWVRPYYADIEQVEAVDTYTLRVRLKNPSGGLPSALAGYFQGIPMASPKSYETYGKDWVRHPSGTGPYTLKELVPGDHVTLVKNPSYHKPGLPYLDTLELRIMKDPLTASTALRTGQIDFVGRVPIQLVKVLETNKSIHIATGPEMAPTVSFLNMRVKPFDDVRARRAVGGYGLNRAEIAQVAFQGRTQPLVSVLPRGVPGAINLNELYPYDPAKAGVVTGSGTGPSRTRPQSVH
jgi:glutathione transport system substrate-binding protein